MVWQAPSNTHCRILPISMYSTLKFKMKTNNLLTTFILIYVFTKPFQAVFAEYNKSSRMQIKISVKNIKNFGTIRQLWFQLFYINKQLQIQIANTHNQHTHIKIQGEWIKVTFSTLCFRTFFDKAKNSCLK